jgi:hypothetical protein
METWTITFGECVENHVGMQQHGAHATHGFTRAELELARTKMAGYDAELFDLSSALPIEKRSLVPNIDSACLLVVRSGIDLFHDYEQLEKEIQATRDVVDKKALMRGKVVNKHARWNLCFADEHIEPNFPLGQGTVLAFSEVPCLEDARTRLPSILGEKARSLLAELNYYYDTSRCGIGYHGDSERRLVVGFRVGATLPLHYQWYHEGKPVGENIRIDIHGGDFYVMGEKAVGTDWKKRKVPTLRHAAGSPKYVALK